MSSPSETVLALNWPDRTLAGWVVGYLVCTLVLVESQPNTMLAIPIVLLVTFVWCVRSGYRRPNVVPAATIGALGLVCSLYMMQQSAFPAGIGTPSARAVVAVFVPLYSVVALVGTVYGTTGHVTGRTLQL